MRRVGYGRLSDGRSGSGRWIGLIGLPYSDMESIGSVGQMQARIEAPPFFSKNVLFERRLPVAIGSLVGSHQEAVLPC